jgi:glucose-1-phosphate thymidylyltransferase
MKGLLLLGGSGSRMRPLTNSFNKHFLPIYDKPLYYYPLSTLMLMGINEVGIVSDQKTLKILENQFGTGVGLGCKFTYIEQDKPLGIANGIKVAGEFLLSDLFTLILGDNFFYGVGLGQSLLKKDFKQGAKIFGYRVSNPEDYGVMRIEDGKILEITEKPKDFISNIAITGLYQFDDYATKYVNGLSLSARKEYEITDLLNIYLQNKSLDFELLPRGTAWLDTGLPDSLLEASLFVKVIEQRQGFKIGCLEEIAYRNGWISNEQLLRLSSNNSNSKYYNYLEQIAD